ncbi:MAG: hypothetical protein OEW87_15350, partial [Flavobacteriaceae bacterium]|nr:hypothetical protein [Flavobacteriaceae bacterium]
MLIDLLKIIISWPVVFLIIFACLFFSKKIRQALIELLKPFQKIKIGSAELILDKEEASRISKNIRDTFNRYREQVNSEYNLFVERYNIDEKLEAVVESIKENPKAIDKKAENIRYTIHVPDVLFADTL